MQGMQSSWNKYLSCNAACDGPQRVVGVGIGEEGMQQDCLCLDSAVLAL